MSGVLVGRNIDLALDELEPQRVEAQAELDRVLENSGLPKDKIESLKKQAQEEGGLFRLLSDPDLLKLPDLSQQLFGRTLTNTESASLDKLIDNFVSTHPLTDEQKIAWELAKKAGTGGLWILAILLAIPAGVAYGMVTTGLSSAGGRR